MTDDNVESPNHPPWALDRRVPIVLLLGLLFQVGVVVYYFGTLESRMATLESVVVSLDRIGSMETSIESLYGEVSSNRETVVTRSELATLIASQTSRIQSLERRMDYNQGRRQRFESSTSDYSTVN